MIKLRNIVLILLLNLIPSMYMAAQDVSKKKVAVYTTGDVDNSIKKIIGAKLVTAITSSGVYAAVERTADFLAALAKESDYQTSGEVRDSQIAQLGQKFGVKYVVVADVNEVFDELFIASRLINVETGLVEHAFDISGAAESLSQLIELSQGVASGLFRGVSLQANYSESASKSSGDINGHQYVDLGLPSGTKWATCNLGATSPVQVGKYYAWGCTTPYVYNSDSRNRLPNFDISGNVRYDAATANWGAPWRIPKKYEWKELLNKCQIVPAIVNGIKVVKVIGPNNNSILFSRGGHLWGSDKLECEDFSGDYWASDPMGESRDEWNACSVHLRGEHGTQIFETNKILGGLTIRPVAD